MAWDNPQDRASAPPVHAATQFAISYSLHEIIVGYAQAQIAIHHGTLAAERHLDWVGAIAMSPPAAKTLSMMLGEAVAQYEARHGEIKTEAVVKAG